MNIVLWILQVVLAVLDEAVLTAKAGVPGQHVDQLRFAAGRFLIGRYQKAQPLRRWSAVDIRSGREEARFEAGLLLVLLVNLRAHLGEFFGRRIE